MNHFLTSENQRGRLDLEWKVRPETGKLNQPPLSTYVRRFYFDTITQSSMPLKFLVNLFGAERVVLGTDIAFDIAGTHFAEHLFAVEEVENATDEIT